jgi:hypothetical protein
MIRRWLPPIVAVCFLMAGTFKSAAPFDRSPVDLTLLFALLTASVVAWVLLSTRSLPRAAISMLVGFAILLLPVLWAPATTYARSKVVDVFTLTLLAAIAPAILVRDRGRGAMAVDAGSACARPRIRFLREPRAGLQGRAHLLVREQHGRPGDDVVDRPRRSHAP